MRSTTLPFLFLSFLLTACSPAGGGATSTSHGNHSITPTETTVESREVEGFPSGYQNWNKLRSDAIIREEDGEARWLYMNAVAATVAGGDFPNGSILVKAHHRLNGSLPGTAFQLSVMHKTGNTEHNGWTFRTFEPDGEALATESDVCVLCHSQRAQTDFVFSSY
jgi:hypothetical protein